MHLLVYEHKKWLVGKKIFATDRKINRWRASATEIISRHSVADTYSQICIRNWIVNRRYFFWRESISSLTYPRLTDQTWISQSATKLSIVDRHVGNYLRVKIHSQISSDELSASDISLADRSFATKISVAESTFFFKYK